jgi:hypothetical protein
MTDWIFAPFSRCLAGHLAFRRAAMRTPVDLVATTKGLKDRCERVADTLMAIAQQKAPILQDPAVGEAGI